MYNIVDTFIYYKIHYGYGVRMEREINQYWYDKFVSLTTEKEFNIGLSEELERFLKWFCCQDNPASLGHHLNKQWGLIEHTYNVALNMLELNRKHNFGYNQYSCLKVALCHDLDKVWNHPLPNLTPKTKAFVKGKPLCYDPKKVSLDHGWNSVRIVLENKYFALDDMEIQAIAWHMLAWDYEHDWDKIKGKVMPFTKLLGMSDNLASEFEPVYTADEDDSPLMAYAKLVKEQFDRGDI